MPSTRWIALLTLVAYALPWVANTGAALTLNAYDLAEWLSLHPVVRSASLPLLATFALRVLPLLIAVMVVFDRNSTRVERLAFPVLIALALLPPLDFFRTGLTDPNFRQQFGLSMAALMLAGLGNIRWLRDRGMWVQLIVSLGVIASGGYALMTGLELMRSFGLSVQIGIGGVFFLMVMTGGLVKFCEATFFRSPRRFSSSTEITQT